MKFRRNMVLVAALLALVLTPSSRALAAERPFSLGPGSELWIEGTSTMHDYESRSNAVELEVTLDPAAAPPATVNELYKLVCASGVQALHLRVPVASLKSPKQGLDKNLRKTMDAEHHPHVQFVLGKYTCKPAAGDTLALHAQGSLTVKGQSKDQVLDAVAWRTDKGVWLQGSQVLRMTEFGMKPPTMMLGALKVGDRITVRYRLLLVPGTAAANVSSGSAR